jgi:hypothetical protein
MHSLLCDKYETAAALLRIVLSSCPTRFFPRHAHVGARSLGRGECKPIEVTIARDVIRAKSVRSHSDGNDIGYIRITQFTEQTTDGLKYAHCDLTKFLRDVSF